jgi:hypothetical protein
MTRVAAHFVYVNPENILKLGVVERNEQGLVTNIFSLSDHRHETAQSIFFNGIIAPLPYPIDTFRQQIKEFRTHFPDANILELLKKMDLPPIEIGKQVHLVQIDNNNIVALE